MSGNLPKRNETFDQESESVLRFKLLIPRNKYLVRSESGGDYGVDLVLELKDKQHMTNFRIHMQLKSNSTKSIKEDGTFDFNVPVKTLNYLMNQPRSIFVVYIQSNDTFLWEWVSNIHQYFKSEGVDLLTTTKKNIKFTFQEKLTYKSFDEIFDMVSNHGALVRDISLRLMNGFEMIPNYGGAIDETIDNFRSEFTKAEDFENNEQYAKALEKYDTISKFIKKERLYIKCATMAELINENKKAIKYCDLALNLNHRNFDANIVKGTCLGRLKKYKESLKYLEKALFLHGEHPIVLNNLAFTWLMNNDAEKAIFYYTELLKNEDNNIKAQTHVNIALCCYELFKFSEAFYHIDQTLKLDPYNSKALAVAGKLHRFLGNDELAEKYFRESLDIDPDEFTAISGLALILVSRKDDFEAVHYFGIWIKEYGDLLFGNRRQKEQNTIIIDMTWNNAKPILLKKVSKIKYVISYNKGEEHHLELQKKDWVGVGAIIDENDTPLFPFILKVYEKELDASQTIKKIIEEVPLSKIDSNSYIDNQSSIQVLIKELDKTVFFTITFDTLRITGSTAPSEKNGFRQFLKAYNRSREVQIEIRDEKERHLINISGITKITFT